METIIVEFQKTTKYPIIQFLTDYQDFIVNSYPALYQYFSGETESVDNRHMIALDNMTYQCKEILATFSNFSNKLSNCGYWELLDYVDSLNTIVERVNKFPKFLRTTLGKRGYTPSIVVNANLGGLRTIDDVANSVRQLNQDNTDWIQLMKENDLNEDDWDIKDLSKIDVFVNNRIDVVVTTILDMPIGKRVYGKDISRRITFVDNDLLRVEYEDNIDQKCNILLEINRGDIPENMLMGKNIDLIAGLPSKQFYYPELITDIQNNFLQNDLFQYANVTNFSIENGSMTVTVEIKTKYDYKTAKKVVI